MTDQEKLNIIDAVLTAIRTNTKTINQLTPVTSLSANDYFEVSGGRRIAYTTLAALIAALSEGQQGTLQQEIEQRTLTAVNVAVTESTATLTIQSVGKTISTTIPIATDSKVGLITPLEKTRIATTYDIATVARDKANTAETKAQQAKELAETLNGSIGEPNGIAPLDNSGRVPSTYLPGYVDDVVEFDNLISGITIQQSGTLKKSTDSDVMVFFDTDSNQFVLGVLNASSAPVIPLSAPGNQALTNDEFINLHRANLQQATDVSQLKSAYMQARTGGISQGLDKTELDQIDNELRDRFIYYNAWVDRSPRYVVESDKIYVATFTNQQYRWSGSQLTVIGSDLALGETASTAYPGNKGKQNADNIAELQNALNNKADDAAFNHLSTEFEDHCERSGIAGYDGTIYHKDECRQRNVGEIVFSAADRCFYLVTDGEPSTSLPLHNRFDRVGTCLGPRLDVVFRHGNQLTKWDGEKFVNYLTDDQMPNSPGNEFNVTAEVPLPSNSTIKYYSLVHSNPTYSAVHVALERGYARLGMRITFAIGVNAWKTYKYVGSTTNPGDFVTAAYWLDEATMSAGDEDFVNINRLCDHPGAYASLAFALADLTTKENQSGITYRKPGLVIEYRTDDQTWELKKFIGNIANFQNSDYWEDIGNGAMVQLVAKSDPEENGTDAFSTGGAYELIPVAHRVVREGAETTITLLNSAGNPVMDPITIVATGGSGEGGGISMGITAEKAAVYAALGTPMLARFAIRSETITANSTTPNAIEKVEIIDRDTNQPVHTWTGSMESAASLDKEVGDYNFVVDLKDVFSTASVKRLMLIATDENGKTASRAFQAVAEDVTISCRQPLDYNSGNRINPASSEASFDCYQFANTTSAVTAYVDMLIDGEWVNIHQKELADNNKNHTKSITFNPQALGLHHGAYQIRMYGISKNSGVKGNTIYSTVFVVEEGNDHSMVGLRYDDANNGEIRNFDTIFANVSAYKPGNVTGLDVNVALNGNRFASVHLTSGQTELVATQVMGHDTGDEIILQAHVGAVFSPEVRLTVNGSAVDVSLKENATLHFDFASRNNNESDHSITSNGVTFAVNGANWLTNGFIPYLGETALRFAENVTGEIPLAPFGNASIENNGMSFQMKFATDNVANPNAPLFECYDPTAGASMTIKGNEISIGNGRGQFETRRFECGVIHTLQVVAEPGTIYEERSGTRYAHFYLYLDGEKIARLPYTPGRNPSQLLSSATMHFDGTHGDFYLYNLLYWNSYFDWSAAMGNYLAKLKDVGAMITEFEFEDVLRAQTAEDVQMMRPQIEALLARGIACAVLVGSKEDFDRFDSGTDTSEDFYFDVYYFDPIPWRSWIGRHVRIRRQGTTSAKRPKKNVRMYLNKATSIEPMYPNYADDHALTPEQLIDLHTTYALFAMKYVRVEGSSIPVQIATIKIDYSDSTGANDSGTCNMLNATFRSLAHNDPMFLTPAQRAFNGTWDKGDVHLSGLEMNHSTANAICAIFRSVDNMQSSYFEAKGNFKEDKSEQVALGFIDTPGYNLGCKNWQSGDFVAVYGNPGETLDQIEARFKAMNDLDTDQLYLLQPYCSRNYRFMRYRNGQWSMSPGSMRQVNGNWVVTGDVLNPVNGWEMLNYTGMNWCQGVASVDDLMRGSTEYSSWVQKLINKGKIADGANVPAWTYYFECMVDNDDLALAYAQGKVVPFELYQFLRFTDAADYATKENWQSVWRQSAWKYLSLRSNYVTRAAEDYNSMRDSVSKNKQPMSFLEDGHCVVNGIYDPDVNGAESVSGFNCEFGITEQQSPCIIYFNKVYDIDGANDKDNDGGGTGDPEEDPDKPTDPNTGYVNTYAGWGSVLFKSCVMQDEAVINGNGDTLSYRATVKAMRSCQTTLSDGSLLNPFSPEGAIYYYVTSRTKRWPKQVSSFDGYRKYEQYTATSDAIYFYALQGLGLASIPQYIRTRWRFRDGFYETGAFSSLDSAISGRIEGPENGKITVVAKKSGYFGIGNDSPGAVTERVYLEAGESYAFTNFRKNNNALLFIYQADRLASIDLSEFSLSDTFDFSHMKLAEIIKIGSETHVNRSVAFNKLTHPNIGNLPFLHTLDIQNTEIESINAEGCPRLAKFYAQGSRLATLTLAPTSPVYDVSVPATMTELRFVGLPSLSYPGGLTKSGFGNVGTLVISTSPRINAGRMIADIVADQEPGANGKYPLAYVFVEGSTLMGDGSEMLAIIERGVKGINGSETSEKPIVRGVYSLNTIIEQSDVETIEAGIDGITVAIVIEAYINAINEVNGESYAGMEEVENISVDNVAELALRYYNGETYEEWLERYNRENVNINSITD